MKRIHETHWKEKGSRKRISEWHRRIFSLVPNINSVFDVGCGEGTLLSLVKKKTDNVAGMDISRSSLNLCKKRGIKTFLGDLQDPNLKLTGRYDVVLMGEVIEHIVDLEVAFNNIIKLLNKKGIVIISTPNFSFFVYRLMYLLGKAPVSLYFEKNKPIYKRSGPQLFQHVNLFNFPRLKKLLTHNKLSVIADKSFTVIPFSNKLFGRHKYVSCPFFKNFFASNIVIMAMRKK